MRHEVGDLDLAGRRRQRVTSRNVFSTYARVAVAASSAGASSQRPCDSSPSSAPNMLAES